MDKCTQNLVNADCEVDNTSLEQALLAQVLSSANEAISLYIKRPSAAFHVYCEDALTDLKPFAELARKHNSIGWLLHSDIINTLDKLQRGEVLCEIEMPTQEKSEQQFFKGLEELLNEGLL